METFNLHLISDSTGETVNTIARASLAQFDDARAATHIWNMVRSRKQIEEVLVGIRENPGIVLYSLVKENLRIALEEGCSVLTVPTVNVLAPVITAFADFMDAEVREQPGLQHAMDREYFDRLEAINFALAHDDGQATGSLREADVILVGVSRTTKTPTSIYLANRGIKAANVPFVPGCPPPEELEGLTDTLVVGLTKDPRGLVQIRKNRLRMLKQDPVTDYVDTEAVAKEVTSARRYFEFHDWPVIDVSRKSIEEVAATIIQMISQAQDPMAQ